MDLSITTKVVGDSNQAWIAGGTHGIEMARSITLDSSAFTQGTHFPDGYIRSGTPLGRITATGLYAPYVDAAVDGTGVLAGFLLDPVKPGNPNTIDVGGALYEHGRVKESELPIAIDANGRTDAAGRIIFV